MLFSLLAHNRIETYFLSNSQKEWIREANLVASQIVENSTYLQKGEDYSNFMSQISQIGNELSTSVRVVVIDKNGYLVADSSRIDINSMLISNQVLNALNKRDSAERILKDGKYIMSTAVAIRDLENTNNILGVVLLSVNIDDVYLLLEEVSTQIYVLSLFTSVLTGLLSFFVSAFFTRPIKELMSSVEEVTNGRMDEKIIIKGRSEMAELAKAFNLMTAKLQRVDETRQDFVSNVSHELKTPLASIKVLSDSLINDKNTPIEMYQEFFLDINHEVDRLNTIINDLLSLVKLDSNKLHLNLEETNLNQLTNAILKRLAPLATQKAISLVYESERDIKIEVDPLKLTLAISNLIENGIKYTPEHGEVSVIIKEDSNNAYIIVQDTGIGIANDELPKIFERFYRTDKTRNRETGGTGLGLSITYRTVIMHKGSINVTSEEGKGSKFIVQLPLMQSK
ncbi:sensor histidine kinase [Candidatus Epulonipiscium viviparus]|uniref:sensor histidine kinase n=1 Tax=Candidatus Epulonipiscium viviparus TaxID=420336 RepID=UPI00049543A3|nr:sensor histidine kinase [Candidatus Epulopiscium viviparus]